MYVYVYLWMLSILRSKIIFDVVIFCDFCLIVWYMCVCVFVYFSGRFSESLMEMMKKFVKDVYLVSI